MFGPSRKELSRRLCLVEAGLQVERDARVRLAREFYKMKFPIGSKINFYGGVGISCFNPDGGLTVYGGEVLGYKDNEFGLSLCYHDKDHNHAEVDASVCELAKGA